MKLLIIPGYSREIGEANWICLNELLETFKKYPGLSVEVVGATLDKKVSRIRPKQFLLYINKIMNWPVVSPKATEQCYQEIVDALSTDSYDSMLVMHMPYDGVLATVRAKKKFPGVRLFLYELDPITYEIDKQRRSLGKYLFFMRVLAEKRTYKACDKIFHMECNREKYADKKYDCYRAKFEYLDFPLIHHNENRQQSGEAYKGQTIRLIYTGKLMTHFRSPTYLLDVLKEVKKTDDIQVRFFSAGDCENQLAEFATENSWIEQCGYVDKETLGLAIEGSDCLVNIGNKISNMLPSKLLTYIETGKPILHVKNQENDACVPYLEKYDLALIIDENDPVKDSASRLVTFLQNTYRKCLSSDAIVKTYRENTPEYSAERIYNVLCISKEEKG